MKKMPRSKWPLVLLLGALFASAGLHARADIELRLVPYDDHTITVDVRVSEFASKYYLYPYTLTEHQRDTYIPPYDCWARNIMLDGKPAFEIYYKGRYVDRLPIARPKDLKPGDHVIWPGDHVFTLHKDGSITTEDKDLLVSTEQVRDESGAEMTRRVVRIVCYPLTIKAVNAEPRAPKPRELIEEIPLPSMALRDATHQALVAEAKTSARELLPDPARHLSIRCWIPANTVGKGFELYPLKHTLHLGSDGVAEGPGYAAPGWRHEEYAVVLPMNRLQAQGPPGSTLMIENMQLMNFSRNMTEDFVNLYPRDEPYVFRVADVGPSILIEGDLTRLPNKVLRVDWSGPEHLYQRGMLVESEARHLEPGASFQARIRAIDTRPAVVSAAAVSNAVLSVRDGGNAVKGKRAVLSKAMRDATAASNKLSAARAPYTAAVEKRNTLRAQIADLKKKITGAQGAAAKAENAAAELTKAEAALAAARAATAAGTKGLAAAEGLAAHTQQAIDASTKSVTAARLKEKTATTRVQKATAALGEAKKKGAQPAINAAQAEQTAANQALVTIQSEIAAEVKRTDRATARIGAEQKAVTAARARLEKAKAAEAPALATAQRLDKQNVMLKAASDSARPDQIKQQLAKAEQGLVGQDKAVADAQQAVAGPVKQANVKLQGQLQAVKAAQAGVNSAERALQAMRKSEAGSRARSGKANNENPLGDVALYARIQSRRSTSWMDLPVELGDAGYMTASVPGEMAPGVYRLRLGVTPTEPSLSSMYVDQWVTIAAPADYGIGLFTSRGRDAFYRGEDVRLTLAIISAGAPVPAGTRVAVEVEDEWGGTVSLLDEALAEAIESRKSFLVQLDASITQSLAPGRYRARARIGGVAGPTLEIMLIDPAPQTHFMNLLLGKYNKYNGRYSSVIGSGNAVGARERNHGSFPMRSTQSADELVASIADSGYNAFKGMCYGMARVFFPDSDTIAQLVRERPELGPWEAYTPASGRDQFLNACIKRNVSFYENLFTQHDSMMPRGEKFLQACERYTTLEAASMRHHPAFRGVCLYDEFSQSLDHDTAGIVMAHFHKADERNYRRKHGGRTSSQASAALDRFTGRAPGMRKQQDVEIFRTWPDHLSQQWGDFSARMAGAVKAVMPSARNFTLARIGVLPGDNFGDVSDWEDVFASLDIASVVGYKDMGGWGDFPVSGPIMADILRNRDGLLVCPMIYGLQTGPYSGSNMRHAFFTLSQNVDGLTFFQFESSAADTSPGDNYDGVRDIINGLTTRYGDLFLAAERGYKKVAIYYSRDADVLSTRKPIKIRLACEGAWAACMRAGYPADFLTDSQVQNDEGMAYDVIIAPGWYIEKEMPGPTFDAMTRLVQAGKVVAVERDSRIDVVGVQRLETNLDEVDDRLGGTFPKYLDFDNERWWDMTRETASMLRDFLSQHVPPAAVHDLLASPDWLRCRDAEYLVVANHAFTGFTGNHKTLYQAPDVPTIKFPKRPPVCYDVLAMKRVQVALEGDMMSLEADMRHVPGAIYAFLPAEIEKVSLRASESSRAGADWNYEIAALDDRGEVINAGIPIEIVISNSEGRELQHIYRAAVPRYRGVYRIPVNGVQAGLRIRVRELISGREATAELTVTPGQLNPTGLVDDAVFISNAEQIRNILDTAPDVVGYRFARRDLTNPHQFVRRLKGDDELSRYIREERLAADVRDQVKALKRRDKIPESLAGLLVDELNKLVDAPLLFTPKRFPPGILRIETGRVAENTPQEGNHRDMNRLLLEEYYADSLQRREPLYVLFEEPWLREQAVRLRRWFEERDVRVRIGSAQPWLREPMPGWGFTDNELVGLDGSRLWRGTLVQPGVFFDSPVIVLGGPRGMVTRLRARDLLPFPVSENFPGRGRAVMGWTRKAFSVDFDTIHVLCTDEEGLRNGVDALLDMDERSDNIAARPTVLQPSPDTAAPVAEIGTPDMQPTTLRDTLSSEDRVTVIEVDPATGRALVGTAGFGQNLFCFADDGSMLWKTFLPEHEIYYVKWIDGGNRVVAATAHGWRVFILNGADGGVIRKFSSTEWPDLNVGEREFATRIDIVLNPPARQILILGRSGIMAVDYDGKKMWFYDRLPEIVDYPTNAVQTAFASFGRYVAPVAVVPSPNGAKIAYNEFRYFASTYGFGGSIVPLWRNEPQLLDARSGKLLLYNTTSDPGSSDRWRITWEPDSSHIWIHASNLSAPLRKGPKGPDGVYLGELGDYVPPSPHKLKGGGWVKEDFHFLQRFDASGAARWDLVDKTDYWITDFDTLADDHSRTYRSGQNGWIMAVEMDGGTALWKHKMPFRSVLALGPNHTLIAGSRNGVVTRLDAAGKVMWSSRIRDLHEVPPRDYPEYLQTAARRDPDSTAEFFGLSRERPDDFNGILRMGIEQLDNGNLENPDGWTAVTGTVDVAAPAFKGSGSLQISAGQLVTTPVNRRVIRHATYLLEFYYRTSSRDKALTAGAVLTSSKAAQTYTLSTFNGAPGEWVFGRVAIKTHADTEAIEIGFEAAGAPVSVDAVSLRPVRFPSANLIANDDLHKIEPTHPKDFRDLYTRVPHNVKEDLMSANHARVIMQATPLGALVFRQEHGFLHNGRLDDIGNMWCYKPNPMGFTVVFSQEYWVSHVVLYLNNTTPDMTYRTISILANDCMATPKVPRTVGHVRGNLRRFVVVRLDEPVLTDNIKILPGHQRTWQDSLTEIEIYGPVGGPDSLAQSGFADDPHAVPMFMDSPSHVPATFAQDLVGTYVTKQQTGSWSAPAVHAGITVVDELMTVANAVGRLVRQGDWPEQPLITPLALTADRLKALRQEQADAAKRSQKPFMGWHAGTVTPISTPARYSGRLIVGCADYRVHAVADNGVPMWEFATAGRVYSSPTPDGDEVYFGSDDGKLYKVDIDSGMLIWEFTTGDRIRGAPAVDKTHVYLASWDGHVYCIDKRLGKQRWKSPIAPLSSSSPAVAKGRVYVGDDEGGMHCLDAATGKSLAAHKLDDRISTCPVVTPDGIAYVGDTGKAAFVGTSLNVVWSRDVLAALRKPNKAPPRVTGQPQATQSQLVLPTSHGLLVLTRATGATDTRFVPPRKHGVVVAATVYGKRICVVENRTQVHRGDNGQWIVANRGAGEVWEPQ